MLGRLISDFFGGKRAAAQAPVADATTPRPPAPRVPLPVPPVPTSPTPDARRIKPPEGTLGAIELLAGKLQQLCGEGRVNDASKELFSELPSADTPAEAVEVMQRIVVPMLNVYVQTGDASLACGLESLVYERLIKRFEEPSHYEQCFGLLDADLHALGALRAPQLPALLAQPVERPQRLLFLLHNLNDDLAHVVLLCDVIHAHLEKHPEEGPNIGLVGLTGGALVPRLAALQQRFGVRVIEIKALRSHADYYAQCASSLASEGFDRLIVVASPFGLSFLTGLLHPSRLSWLSMKFELATIKHLCHRASFCAGVRRSREVGGRRWLEAPPFFTGSPLLQPSAQLSPVLKKAREFGTVFYTINREEKIRSPQFLAAVSAILERVPNSCFVWTGRRQLAEVDAFFSARGQTDRHLFAGWILPDDLLHQGDIFLDTPVLSGTVAARAVVLGRPVLTWTDAQSWVNFFSMALAQDRLTPAAAPLVSDIDRLAQRGASLECASHDQYVEQAVLLAQSQTLRDDFGQVLKAFAERYFSNAAASAEAHFENFREPPEALPPDEALQQAAARRDSGLRADLQGLRVTWVVDQFQGNRREGWHTAHASVRYRALRPAEALAQQGAQVDVVMQRSWQALPRAADVVVIGKIFINQNVGELDAHARSLLEQVKIARAAGVFVIADFVDAHFDRPDVGKYWRSLAANVDACVACTESMADIVRQHTKQPVAVVADPVASSDHPPRAYEDKAKPLKLVWYGHPNNWKALVSWLEPLGETAIDQPFVLTVVTRPEPDYLRTVDEFNRRYAPHATMVFVPWSEAAQWNAVHEGDLVIVPSNPSDSTRTVKSSNRLTDALHAGRYVIASPLPAYLPYGEFVSLTNDPVDALEWFLAHPDEALAKIAKGKAAVVASCGLEVIAASWSDVFRRASVRTAPALSVVPAPTPQIASASAAAGIRLNLGCGDKILQGYINVDVVEARRGFAPDVLCDLRELSPFDDDYADEILSVHVVEHFWRWEVEDILREWIRVLKPGGKLILECPNLQAACEAFLQDPEGRSGGGQEGQTTMWVFYGDPRWKDPLMIHRWGYTPASLGRMLESVGLIDVAQQPAQYKLREPRDMRIVGYKPFE